MPMSPAQRAWRTRIEAGLRVAEPVLNLLLAACDHVSRVADRGGLGGGRGARGLDASPGRRTSLAHPAPERGGTPE